ncbi:mercuric ion binding protein [Pseudomonas sp. SJZ079]|uniref:mercury resistance system periplasmic binding protein MerP n=1 Tax=Pseudomonas sp. SJZ079 TaxID=2572887 RepID=UPI00119B0365|nr:mercury resistance system periplasmic binding protein MerP [Pseudomonas sp. SJZ079]TWC29133.1 mercuric ion binding protein [Pseudomonas sp. SJZ079]
MKKSFACLALIAWVSPAWAASQTVTLSVPGMTCAACPITVKHALSRVEGVSAIKVNVENREAIVTFDDSKTNVQALSRATENAGYPSSAKE